MSEQKMLAAAKAELVKLEAELMQNSTYRRFLLTKQVIETYQPKGRLRPDDPIAPGHTRMRQSKYDSTKLVRIERAAREYLTEKGARATSGEILHGVTSMGVEVGGQNPVKAISAYLSNAEGLNNVRALGGYGLKEWGTKAGPNS